MSLARRCDICDTRYGEWEFRKRWHIFRWMCCISDIWKENMDVCDSCIKKFKEFVKQEKTK